MTDCSEISKKFYNFVVSCREKARGSEGEPPSPPCSYPRGRRSSAGPPGLDGPAHPGSFAKLGVK